MTSEIYEKEYSYKERTLFHWVIMEVGRENKSYWSSELVMKLYSPSSYGCYGYLCKSVSWVHCDYILKIWILPS